MAAQNGTEVKILVGAALIENLTTTSLNSSNDTRQTTTKDSQGVHEYEYSFETNEISFEGHIVEGATYGYEQLADAKSARTKIAFEYQLGQGSGTSITYSGNGIITQLDASAPMEENHVFTGTILVDGLLTKGTLA